MKYIKSFSDNAVYEADKINFECPHVGYIEDTDEVKYINDMADLYNIYGTLSDIDKSRNPTIQINELQGGTGMVFKNLQDGNFGFNYEKSDTITAITFNDRRYSTTTRTFKTIDKIGLDTSSMTKIMFSCKKLELVNLSGFDTRSLTSMEEMFVYCSGLTSLDLSEITTSGVTDMTSAFTGCYSLTSIDISNFNTSDVTATTRMFRGCNSLQTVTMNNTNTTTFDMIKAQLVTDSVASHVSIIRDGLTWTYNGSEWVSQ